MHMHGILNKLDLAGSWIWFVIKNGCDADTVCA
jgi:hypothetical protein